MLKLLMIMMWVLVSIVPVVFWGTVVVLLTKYLTKSNRKSFYAFVGYSIIVLTVLTIAFIL